MARIEERCLTMANSEGHRRFSSVRKLPSGRYQVRYPRPRRHDAPWRNHLRQEGRGRALSVPGRDADGEARRINPERGKIRLQDYAERWIAERSNLRPRTVHLYTWTLGKHITPYLGGVPLNRLDTPMVRGWRSQLLAQGISVTMAAKAYRLLRAILMTATKEDELIRINPCRIRGADREKAAERPVFSVPQVVALAERMPDRFRALVLVTTFASLRWGETMGLQRSDIDLAAGTVRVRQAFVEQRGVGLVLGPPKSRAGVRVVALPKAVMPAVASHMQNSAEGFVLTGENGRTVWRGTFIKLVKWSEAVAAAGAPDSTSMTSDTRETPWSRGHPAQASEMSWPGWATTAQQRP